MIVTKLDKNIRNILKLIITYIIIYIKFFMIFLWFLNEIY